MSYQKSYRSSSMLLVALAALCVSTVDPALAQGQLKCKNVVGKLRPQAVADNCTSPVNICATGAFTGPLTRLDFVATAVTNTDLTPETNVIVITGNSTEQARNGGTLMTKDTIVLKTDGTNEFAEVDVITGGTGAYEGATGQVQIFGTFPATGVGEARYRGQVCTP